MAVVRLPKNKAADPIERDAIFDWRDLAVGRRLLYAGAGYDEPAVFEITGVSRNSRWRRVPGSEVRDFRDRIEVRCGEDVRTLGVSYVKMAALWSLIRET